MVTVSNEYSDMTTFTYDTIPCISVILFSYI